MNTTPTTPRTFTAHERADVRRRALNILRTEGPAALEPFAREMLARPKSLAPDTTPHAIAAAMLGSVSDADLATLAPTGTPTLHV